MVSFGSWEKAKCLVRCEYVLRSSTEFHEILQFFFVDSLMFPHETLLKADLIASRQVIGGFLIEKLTLIMPISAQRCWVLGLSEIRAECGWVIKVMA